MHLASYVGVNAIEICLIYIEKMPNKKKLDFDVKRYLVAEVLYPDHVVPLHVGECLGHSILELSCSKTDRQLDRQTDMSKCSIVVMKTLQL